MTTPTLDDTVVTGTDTASAMAKAPQWITAEKMAKKAGIAPKRFRAELRRKIHWHDRYARWKVMRERPEYADMLDVLLQLAR